MKANCSKEERAERLKCRIEEFLLNQETKRKRANKKSIGTFSTIFTLLKGVEK